MKALAGLGWPVNVGCMQYAATLLCCDVPGGGSSKNIQPVKAARGVMQETVCFLGEGGRSVPSGGLRKADAHARTRQGGTETGNDLDKGRVTRSETQQPDTTRRDSKTRDGISLTEYQRCTHKHMYTWEGSLLIGEGKLRRECAPSWDWA